MSILKHEEYGVHEAPFTSTIIIDNESSINITLVSADKDRDKDSTTSREAFWRSLFGDTPMPAPDPDVIRKVAGMLGRDIGVTAEDVEAGLAQIE